jgi:mono/diheme cytochrome c family protein
LSLESLLKNLWNAPEALWSAAACCRFSPASLLAPYRSKYCAPVHDQQAGPAAREKAAASCRTPELALQRVRWVCLALCTLFLAGCRLDMHVQPKYNPLDPSDFFGDGRSARPEVPGTVAHGHLRAGELLYTGKLNGQTADAFPFPITREVLERGRERYDIYCSPCHDYTGGGRGMVVQRGFPPPPSYHLERLVKAPAGHFFEVISNGYGAMYSYAARVAPEDRWAIVAYIRALQLSQHARLEDVPPAEREQLKEQAK